MKRKRTLAANDTEAPDTGVYDTEENENEEEEENEASDLSALAEQIGKEYDLSARFMKPKRDKWGVRLKLYNNQKRNDEAVGDPLLFTTFNTVFAALWDDRMQQEWE